jgi:hypothetical protein
MAATADKRLQLQVENANIVRVSSRTRGGESAIGMVILTMEIPESALDDFIIGRLHKARGREVRVQIADPQMGFDIGER